MFKCQLSRVKPSADKDECLYKHRNIVYRALRVFIVISKLFGYLPWHFKPRDQSTSKAKLFSYVYQIGFIGSIWLFGQAIDFLSLHYYLKNESNKLNSMLIKSVYYTSLVSSGLIIGYCIFYSNNYVIVFQQWRSLDNILGKKLSVTRFFLIQLIVGLLFFGYLALFFLIFCWETFVVSDASDWLLVRLVMLIGKCASFFTYLIYICCNTVFFTFSCWLFSLTYDEIQNELNTIKESPAKDFTQNVYKMRKRERTVYRLISETNRLFAIPVAIIFIESCFMLCINIHIMVNKRHLLTLMHIVCLIIPILAFSIAADYLYEKRKKLLQAVCDFEIDPKEIDMKEQLQLELLKEKLSKCSVEFSACGFFTISRALITTIFGAILTYLIVLTELNRDYSKTKTLL